MGRPAKTSDTTQNDTTLNFGHKETVLLISLWSENYDNLNRMGSHQEVYEKIAKEMEIHEFVRTWQMCKNKIRNLQSDYRKKKPGVTGASPSTWAYYNSVHEIMNRRASMNEDLCHIGEVGLQGDDDGETKPKKMKTECTSVVPYSPRTTVVKILNKDSAAVTTIEGGFHNNIQPNVTNNEEERDTTQANSRPSTSSYSTTTNSPPQQQPQFVSPGQVKRTERKKRSTFHFQERALEMMRLNREAVIEGQKEIATMRTDFKDVSDSVRKLIAQMSREPTHPTISYAPNGIPYPPMSLGYAGNSGYFLNNAHQGVHDNNQNYSTQQ